MFATPPLRGPDETAHFLRAYGVARGDLLPSIVDRRDRKSVLIPPHLDRGFHFFEEVRVREKEANFSYRPVMESYFAQSKLASDPDRRGRLVPYAGSEGYSPIAYLPHSAAALFAHALELGFLPTLYLMRLAGLVALTAVVACAIAVVPRLAWTFVAIAMLPSALYSRSVISADGSALAAAMLVAALWLRAAVTPPLARPASQSFWMAVSALTKPSNVAFVLLELRLLGESTSRWKRLALTVLPALVLTTVWTFSSGADTAAWRMTEITGQSPESFDPAARLIQLLQEPMHFLTAVVDAWRDYGAGELWRQLIGVLGLFDTVLLPWVYPTITALLAGSFFVALPLAAAERHRVPLLAAITVLAYTFIVYLVSYLVFTPPDAGAVWGVQGRYFVPILPLVAIVVAATVNRGPRERSRAAMALVLAALSGVACLEAILRTDWF